MTKIDVSLQFFVCVELMDFAVVLRDSGGCLLTLPAIAESVCVFSFGGVGWKEHVWWLKKALGRSFWARDGTMVPRWRAKESPNLVSEFPC